MDISQTERLKYEAMWGEYPEYRRLAPGESLVDEAFNKLGMQKGDSLIDYGCGTGRAAKAFRDKGLRVKGIDIADNCLDEGVTLDLIVAPLWDLPTMMSKWGFCTDVMEHIPPTKVDAVLHNIMMRTKMGAFFQIDTREDQFGAAIYDKLHLTVKPADWWLQKLLYYFEKVNKIEDGGSVKFICLQPHRILQTSVHFNTGSTEEERRKVILDNITAAQKRGLPEIVVDKCSPIFKHPVAVVGGGTSLKYTWHELKHFRGDIVAVNGTHDYLLERGIVPTYMVIMDGRDVNKRFLTKPDKRVEYLICSNCAPAIFDALKGHSIRLWNMHMDIGEPTKCTRIGGASTVGLVSISLLFTMGYRDFHLFGMDSCYTKDGHHAYPQDINDNERKVSVKLRGHEYLCSIWQAHQAREFQQYCKVFGKHMNITIHGEGLLAKMVQEGNRIVTEQIKAANENQPQPKKETDTCPNNTTQR